MVCAPPSRALAGCPDVGRILLTSRRLRMGPRDGPGRDAARDRRRQRPQARLHRRSAPTRSSTTAGRLDPAAKSVRPDPRPGRAPLPFAYRRAPSRGGAVPLRGGPPAVLRIHPSAGGRTGDRAQPLRPGRRARRHRRPPWPTWWPARWPSTVQAAGRRRRRGPGARRRGAALGKVAVEPPVVRRPSRDRTRDRCRLLGIQSGPRRTGRRRR